MISPLLAFCVETAYRAGRSTLAMFHAGAGVEWKDDRTPVTEADKRAERMVREAVERAYPSDSILGEEEPEKIGVGRRWVVDPIDGTKSFVSGVPLYATLVSCEDDEGVLVAASYFPALDQMACAERGQGALFNGRPAQVSPRESLDGAVICCGGHASMQKMGRTEGLNRLAERAMATRTWGDAYGHCLVATGRAEAMVDPVVAHYDISAVSLIVREAGGRFTDFLGREELGLEAVSSNGAVHDEVLAAFVEG